MVKGVKTVILNGAQRSEESLECKGLGFFATLRMTGVAKKYHFVCKVKGV